MTKATAPGYAEEDVCNRDGCHGIIGQHPPENCACHIRPPCNACMAPREFCPVCGWDAEYDEAAS